MTTKGSYYKLLFRFQCLLPPGLLPRSALILFFRREVGVLQHFVEDVGMRFASFLFLGGSIHDTHDLSFEMLYKNHAVSLC